MALTRVDFQKTIGNTGNSQSTGTFTWDEGDLFVVIGGNDLGSNALTTPTVGGVAMTPLTAFGNDGSHSYGRAYWYVTPSASSGVITGDNAGASTDHFQLLCWQFRGHGGLGDDSGLASTALTVSNANTGIGSWVVAAWFDFNAGAAGRTGTPTVTNEVEDMTTGNYSVWGGDWSGQTGTVAYGTTTSGGGQLTKVAVEVAQRLDFTPGTPLLAHNDTLAVPIPAGVVAGDLLCMFVAAASNFSSISLSATGWTVLFQESTVPAGGSEGGIAFLYRQADGSESGTVTVTSTTVDDFAVAIVNVHDYEGGTIPVPTYTRGDDNTGTAVHATPSATPPEDNGAVLGFFAVDQSGTSQSWTTSATGSSGNLVSELVDAFETTNQTSLWVAVEQQNTATATQLTGTYTGNGTVARTPAGAAILVTPEVVVPDEKAEFDYDLRIDDTVVDDIARAWDDLDWETAAPAGDATANAGVVTATVTTNALTGGAGGTTNALNRTVTVNTANGGAGGTTTALARTVTVNALTGGASGTTSALPINVTINGVVQPDAVGNAGVVAVTVTANTMTGSAGGTTLALSRPVTVNTANGGAGGTTSALSRPVTVNGLTGSAGGTTSAFASAVSTNAISGSAAGTVGQLARSATTNLLTGGAGGTTTSLPINVTVNPVVQPSATANAGVVSVSVTTNTATGGAGGTTTALSSTVTTNHAGAGGGATPAPVQPTVTTNPLVGGAGGTTVSLPITVTVNNATGGANATATPNPVAVSATVNGLTGGAGGTTLTQSHDVTVNGLAKNDTGTTQQLARTVTVNTATGGAGGTTTSLPVNVTVNGLPSAGGGGAGVVPVTVSIPAPTGGAGGTTAALSRSVTVLTATATAGGTTSPVAVTAAVQTPSGSASGTTVAPVARTVTVLPATATGESVALAGTVAVTVSTGLLRGSAGGTTTALVVPVVVLPARGFGLAPPVLGGGTIGLDDRPAGTIGLDRRGPDGTLDREAVGGGTIRTGRRPDGTIGSEPVGAGAVTVGR